jgi:hypothetical protein
MSEQNGNSNGKMIAPGRAPLTEVELRFHAGRMYMEEQRGVSEIAAELGLSRMRVYNLLNALSLSPKLMLDLQLNDVLENSVNTLAALSERMRDDASVRSGPDPIEATLRQKERETDAKVYATLFDRTMPLMDSFMKHRPAFLKATPPQTLELGTSNNAHTQESPASDLPHTPGPTEEGG